MSRIKSLPEDIIRKIAAGEVVERPASVLKELIENSIDAMADQIDVFVEKGGKKLIQVVDNGVGIHPDDMLDCVKRYTTSKISSEEDLYNINSYGFRGEALFSISSVSKFSIVSRPNNFSLGKELYIEGGIFRSFSDTGSPVGTKVRVKDLFFNTPVRKRFLKSEKTEFLHCMKTFIRYALINTDIHFRLFHNGKELMNLPPSDLKKRISYIFPEQTDSLIEIDHTDEIGKIYGYISLNEGFKKEGIIYVNKRPVKNRELKKLLRSLLSDKFYLIFIELPPYFVDHNIHPSKTEVRFKNDIPVENLIKDGIRKVKKPFKSVRGYGYNLSQKREVYGDKKEFKILGQIEETFIVVYYDDNLYIIDQHILHERINYEILRNGIKKDVDSYRLDKPIVLKISEYDRLLVENKKDILKDIGFLFNIEGDNILIDEIPSFLTEEEARDLFLNLLTDDRAFENFLSEIACRTSIKSGDILSDDKAKAILKRWIETDNPNLCPHGRPIYYRISLDDIKKAVGRG